MLCRSAEPLARLATSNGLTDQEFNLFRATDPNPGHPVTSPEESIELRWFTPAGQHKLLATGHVHDGPTMLALLLSQRRREPGDGIRPA